MLCEVDPELYVDLLYRAVLRRAADEQGAGHYTKTIHETGNLYKILEAFMASPEFINSALIEKNAEAFVDLCYRAVFRRNADLQGKSRYLGMMHETGDVELILRDMISSKEFQDLRLVNPFIGRRKWEWTGGELSVRFGSIASMAQSHPCAGLPDGLDVIVPVHNAMRWLDVTCEGLRKFGIRPLYIVDSNSSDGSLSFLIKRGERAFTVTNEGACCESLLCKVIPHIGSRWLLRFDDDELPSARTLHWISNNIDALDVSIVGLPRQCLKVRDGKAFSCEAADGSWEGDVQYRLFRPDEVAPVDTVHSAGFRMERFHIAPPEAGFLHLDWLVRDEAERVKKIEHYEKIAPRTGWVHKRLYLPEQMEDKYYSETLVDDEVITFACRELTERSLNASPKIIS